MTLDQATVLLVEDLEPLREIYSVWLSRCGCAVLTASDGIAALNLLTTHAVDAVISDIQMPVMGGVELARGIASLDLAIPLLLLSGLDDMDPRKLYALGVEAVIAKPITRNILRERLEISLTPRAELWLEPSADIPTDTITLSLGSITPTTVRLGRGGCSFPWPQRIEPGTLVELNLLLLQEQLALSGQAIVRWYDPPTGLLGVEFVYLAPATRTWVNALIDQITPRSFIPGDPA